MRVLRLEDVMIAIPCGETLKKFKGDIIKLAKDNNCTVISKYLGFLLVADNHTKKGDLTIDADNIKTSTVYRMLNDMYDEYFICQTV